ncbi:Potassium channel subfamily K member 13 [Zootermopsis nevadensis]|uniref:Potassium channel subfamily K member 13 n=1 Tax=Zootermopsis nevadensis TaxID=136037 RepID=A0A067R5J8_ZOONE|nr:Potassium channel subfamily K member 13 [Zootermopsis nevadensis]
MGCCSLLHLTEDNARFLLLAIVLVLYMLAGATLFQYLEGEEELRMVREFWRIYSDFRRHYGANQSALDMDKVHQLLYAYGNATSAGIIHKRRRWDFAGSFHFVGTIVSTIGYGNTTPQTTAGKAVVIIYGFLGCSGGILFFNLFLERIITFLAFVLRMVHLRRLKKRMESGGLGARRASRISRASLPEDLDEDDSSLDHWKPSVYWVMLYLTVASVTLALCAAAVYTPFEDWSFFESIYFCFVSFATIGFGDYVSTQEPSYPHVHWYRFGNFVFTVLGCCCIYSLFNVTSIVIKQALNWLIVRLDCRCLEDATGAAGRLWRRQSMRLQQGRKRRRRRSSAGMPANLRRDGVGGGRRLSGEMISMKDFLQANKVSLAVMQKQLYETAQMQRGGCHYGNERGSSGSGRRPPGSFTPGTVGPLAIVTQKLGDSGSGR